MKGRKVSPESLGKSSPGKRAVKGKGAEGSVSFGCSRNIKTDVTGVRRKGQDWTVVVFAVRNSRKPIGNCYPFASRTGNHKEDSTVWI